MAELQESQKKRKITFIAQNLALCAATLFIALVMAESVLRIRESWTERQEQEKRTAQYLSQIRQTDISDNTFNIYYFGESTIVGEPYAPRMTIPALTSYLLDNQVSGKPIRYINMAVQGADFQYSLNCLQIVLKNKNIFKPSLVVIYAGHNEFLQDATDYGFIKLHFKYNNRLKGLLRRSLLLRKIVQMCGGKRQGYTLEIDQRHFFDEPLFSEKNYKQVIDKYKTEILQAVDMTQRQEVPCILSTVAGNYADFEPNRSVYYGNPKDQNKFKTLADQGDSLQRAGNYRNAALVYNQALAIDARFAEIHYRLGKCYHAMGEMDKARHEYEQAVEYDRMPIRATPTQNEFIRKIPENKMLCIADAVEYLRQRDDARLLGDSLMIDGHHPNLKGYILLSSFFAGKIRQISKDTRNVNFISEDIATLLFKLDKKAWFDIYVSRGNWFYKTATIRYDPHERIQKARSFFLKAFSIDSSQSDATVGLALCDLLENDPHRMTQLYLAQIQQMEAADSKNYLKQNWVRQIIDRARGKHPASS